jgi:hypothetical protein
MAWGKNRRGGSAASSGGRGGRRRPPGELTEQDITRSIQQSVGRVRVSLQLEAAQADGEIETLGRVLDQFEQKFEARRSAVVTETRDVRVELLECGLNSWQNLVELQRVLAGLKRPLERGQELPLMSKTTLRHDAKYDEWTMALGFNRSSEDALWRFASALMLRLKSCGVLAKILLPKRLMIPLTSAFVEWGNSEIGEFHWDGRLTWSQVLVEVLGEQREEIQRVHLPPVRDVALANRNAIANLRYPDLVSVVDGTLNGNVDARKTVVIILRGIPGSGKSTLAREIEAICCHRGVAFTACSADYFFETPRGYEFDVKKLSSAHSKCKGDFTRAVQDEPPLNHGSGRHRRPHQHIVLVDNTSTQLWEYGTYEDIAKSNGCRVHIVEMKCTDALTAFRMGQRNSHGVPPDKVVSMFLRWEKDSRAHVFMPQFEHAALTANPLSDGGVGGSTFLGLFLDEGSQQKMLAQIPTVHPNKVSDHVTLFYKPNRQYARDAELGASFALRGVEEVKDERGQTLRVELDDRLSLQMRNKIPHITISTKDGVSASYSNDLLENEAATRTSIDPPIELTAQLGVALLVQNQRVITTTSPFDAELGYCLTNKTALADLSKGQEHTGISTNENAVMGARIFILHIRESDITSDSEDDVSKILRRAQVLHSMGSQCTTRRLLCIQRSEVTSSPAVPALLRRLQNRYLLSSTQYFDDVVFISHSDSAQEFGEAVTKYLAEAEVSVVTYLTMQSTVVESLQWPMREMEYFQDAAMSVSYIGHQGNAVRFDAPLRSPNSQALVFSVLDLMDINIQEQTRSAVFCGMKVVDAAWSRLCTTEVDADISALERIDTTLTGLSSSAIDLCLLLPSGITSTKLQTLQGQLLRELEDTPSIRGVLGSYATGKIYFSLCAKSNSTPVFCVHMAAPRKDTASGTNLQALAQLEFCKQQAKASREICDIEAYSTLTALLRAILLGRCSSLPPNNYLQPSLIILVSERLVLQYLRNTDGLDPMPTAADVTSGRIVLALFRMLAYLSRLDPDEWAAAFGDSLLTLQGNERAQTAWGLALESVMQGCMSVLDAHRCVGEAPKKATPPNPTNHLRVLVSLVAVDAPVAVGADAVSCERAYVEISGRSTWSQAHSLAFCDKLMHAAAMVLPQDDDECRGEYFYCSPSPVTRRIEVTTSSLELLRNVEKMAVLEADSEGALSGDYTIRRAVSDEEVRG